MPQKQLFKELKIKGDPYTCWLYDDKLEGYYKYKDVEVFAKDEGFSCYDDMLKYLGRPFKMIKVLPT